MHRIVQICIVHLDLFNVYVYLEVDRIYLEIDGYIPTTVQHKTTVWGRGCNWTF